MCGMCLIVVCTFVCGCVCMGTGWYVFDCILLGLCVDVFVWVGMCLIVHFWGFGGGSLSHM